MYPRIDIITTTISGSVSDWGKVERILPLFQQHGASDVHLSVEHSHQAARAKACALARAGSRILIAAGGSGTFNSVVEGCYDAETDLSQMRLGFLRKGSADLIGKVLGMPDDIEEAVAVFVESIRQDQITPCDVLRLSSQEGSNPPRHFVGYGGAEIFGDIPHFTENRFIKYYKGFLGQLFGDLGPFFVGMNLAILRRLLVPRHRSRRLWTIVVDDQTVSRHRFQAMVLVNGDLGPNLAFAKKVPLGSGDFHLFAIRNQGWGRFPRQLWAAWRGTITKNPIQWGLEHFRITRSLVLQPDPGGPFPINADGASMECQGAARVEIVGQLNLLSR